MNFITNPKFKTFYYHLVNWLHFIFSFIWLPRNNNLTETTATFEKPINERVKKKQQKSEVETCFSCQIEMLFFRSFSISALLSHSAHTKKYNFTTFDGQYIYDEQKPFSFFHLKIIHVTWNEIKRKNYKKSQS